MKEREVGGNVYKRGWNRAREFMASERDEREITEGNASEVIGQYDTKGILSEIQRIKGFANDMKCERVNERRYLRSIPSLRTCLLRMISFPYTPPNYSIPAGIVDHREKGCTQISAELVRILIKYLGIPRNTYK
jgi:hypothetical protein